MLAATLPHGLTPPVLTDYLDLSIGGTLVVGGIGATTSRYGMQSDNVLELEVVTGTGETVTCSPTDHPELFDAVRAGLGQVAVSQGDARALPAPQHVRQFLLYLPRPDDDAARRTPAGLRRPVRRRAGRRAPRADGGWMYRLEAAAQFSGRPPDDDTLLAGLSDDRRCAAEHPALFRLPQPARGLERALRANGQWHLPHPWLTTFVGDSAVEPVVGAELARLTPADLGQFGQVVLSAFAAASVTSPLLRLPADDCATPST